MTKYHINKHGVPAPCRATKGNCPLGGDDTHFDNHEDAQAYADKINEEKHGTLPGLSQYEMELNEFESELESPTSTERAGFNSSETYQDGSLKDKLVKEFGEDEFVVEVYSEDEDPVNYALHDNGGKVESYYEAKADTNESIHLWSPTEEDWQPRFISSLRNHLRENEGPVKEIYGRKMRKALDPYHGGEFVKDYVDFNEKFQSSRAGLNVENEEMFSRDGVTEKLKKDFGDNSYIVEKTFPTESPLEYALYDGDSDNVAPYYNKLEELNDNPYLWNEETQDWDVDFKESLEKHLKENEGETKEVYGVNMTKALDPNRGAEYLESYVEFNEKFEDRTSLHPVSLNTSDTGDLSEPTANHLKKKFGEGSFITEYIEGDTSDPLSYSINAIGEQSTPYHKVRFEPEFADKVWDNENNDWNEDLKRDLSSYLKQNEGEVKDVYGINMMKIADPNDGANFIREWARNKK